MSNYDKRRIFRVYTYGKSYILSSQAIENEKLQVKISQDSLLSLNKLSIEEWNSLTQLKTNSVYSPSCSLVFDAYGCLGLLSTSDGQSFNSTKDDGASMQHYLIFVKEVISVGQIKRFEIMKITDVAILPLNVESYSSNNQQMTTPFSSYINDIKKFLSSGVFYFSYSLDPNENFDLTLSSQNRYLSHQTNRKFLWNFNLHLPFRRFNVDVDSWLLKIICGCIEIKKIITTSQIYKACLLSRLSCERVGTRFNCRGVNDEGNCANFVETEQLIYSVDTEEETSFLQLRGSVPVFFEQSGLQVGSHRIKLSRSSYACYPAFERHIKHLIHEYGNHILVLNLLGIKGDESILTNFFYHMCQISKYSMKMQLVYNSFDYHQELKFNKQALSEKMWPNVFKKIYDDNHENKSTTGMFYTNKSEKSHQLQTKFIRTNCMDCLDRTNNAQSFIGIEMLQYQLMSVLNNQGDIGKFREAFRQMWILNGDCISKIYAGTGAIQGKSVTQDFSRSLTRAIQNNFLDYTKQDAMETFLYSMSRNYGELADRVKVLMPQTFLRLPYSILKELVSLKKQYIEKFKCRVAIGTWNINGGLKPFDMDELNINEWLLDGPTTAKKTGLGYLDPSMHNNENNSDEIDIFAIGFEEIVDLTAQNIVSSNDENASLWYTKIIECLKKTGKEYVQLIAENLQLVGVCLFVFVLKKHIGSIKDICVSKAKTGFGGTAGNKGGVLLRFIYYNTSMCFVCSHFAAHQKEIKQRNEDFRQIYETAEFVGQAVTTLSKIETKFHDYVFWCGDLNYRIDLPNDMCRSLIAQQAWEPLLKEDQLCIQRKLNLVFREFNEGPILFPPTYKYNLNEDTYDRSEKCRVPAWTDRILWRKRTKNNNNTNETYSKAVKCLYYGRSDIRYSDHRPVSALLEVDVVRVIPNKLIEVLNKIFTSSHGSFQIVLVVTTDTKEMNELVKKEIYELFNKFKSFSSVRYYNNSLYFTYADAKYGYEAFAQLNNHYLESCGMTIVVKIENEQSYEKLIEQELKDCLLSLSYLNDTMQKINLDKKYDTSIEVGDLLGSSFDNGENGISVESGLKSRLNLPVNIRPNSSITNDMANLNTYNVNYDDRHNHHNPMVKALSNSNLQMFDQQQHIQLNNNNNLHLKIGHSAVNLLDLANEEPLISTSIYSNVPPLIPPKRPPPPAPTRNNSNPSLTPTNAFDETKPLFKIEEDNKSTFNDPFSTISNNNNKFGFDDDFGSLAISSVKTEVNSNNSKAPPPLPPLPPFSGNTVNIMQNSTNKPSFSLFDDSFEPELPNQSLTTSNTQQSTRPPPLPPMLQSSSSAAFVPSRPAPPPIPSMISNILRPNSFSNNNSSSSHVLTRPSSNTDTVISDLDLLGDPGESPPPLPIRTNHFI